jgi:hypothetical protein
MHIKLHQHGPTEGISDTGAYVYFWVNKDPPVVRVVHNKGVMH